MTFSALIKDEILREQRYAPCCQTAFCQAVARCAGSLTLGGGPGLSVPLGYLEPLELLRDNLRERIGISASLMRSVAMGGAQGDRSVYTLSFSGNGAERALAYLGIIKQQPEGFALLDEIPAGIVRKECCRRAYLAGAFISSGSAAKPDAAYHMELIFRQEAFALSFQKLMERMKLYARMALRRREFVLYLKESDAIERALILMGAPGATLKLDVKRVEKDVRNRVNREVNCERANIDRTVSAAQRCIDAVNRLSAAGELDKLPAPLRELALIRAAYPEDSLTELGQRLKKPVGKSGVAHRLRRIEEMAERIETGGAWDGSTTD